MKYLKLFENKRIEKHIMDLLNDISDIDIVDIDCPFYDEIMIIHQREYIDSIYWKLDVGCSLGEFKAIYNKMIKDAEKKIIQYITEDPSLYFWVQEYDIDIPDWIKQSNKYNI
jgi:hypothetical protein